MKVWESDRTSWTAFLTLSLPQRQMELDLVWLWPIKLFNSTEEVLLQGGIQARE